MGFLGRVINRLDFRKRDIDEILKLVESHYYFIDCSTMCGRMEAYKKCDLIPTIIGKCSDSLANLRVWALDKDNREVKTREAVDVIYKLNHPNPYEDFSKFFRKLEIFVLFHGKAYVRKSKSKYFGEDYYIIPNDRINPVYSDRYDSLFNRKIAYYEVYEGNNTYRLEKDEVYVFYDNTLDIGGNNVFGESRLRSLSEPVSTYATLWEVSTELYGDGGAKNIISLGASDADMISSPFLKDERKEVQVVLSEHGMLRGKYKNMVTKAKAEVHPLTTSIKELGLSETIKNAITAISNRFSYPLYLFGVEANRYKSTEEALAYFYTNTSIPNARSRIQDWLVMTGNTGLPFRIDVDFSHLEFYQNAKQKQGVALQQISNACSLAITNGFMTVEEARVLMDLD